MVQPADIQSDHTKYLLILDGAFSGSVRIIDGPQMGILYTVTSTQAKLHIITKQDEILKQPLAKLNTKLVIILLKGMHTLKTLRIHTAIMHDLPYLNVEGPSRLVVSVLTSTATISLLRAIYWLCGTIVLILYSFYFSVRYSVILEQSAIFNS
jgi:hypothetical protein